VKIRQNPRHWAAKKALTTPGVRSVATYGLVRLHTSVFLEKADEDRREDRRDHLDAFFDATMDTYLAALQAGFSEAKAREITHIQANLDFFRHGWTEMMEIPADELDAHLERYREFFEEHGISVADPLGEFAPPGDLPPAPATPERLGAPDYRNAVAGYADDVYVETPGGIHAGEGGEEPADVDLSEAPGVDGDEEPTDAD
jgi:hypothetical protein